MGEPGQDPMFFFPFQMWFSVLRSPFLFHHLLYNELSLAAAERKGERGTLSLEASRRRGWSGWCVSGRRLWFGQEMEAAGEEERGAL